jgi:hypothetical protein
LRPRDLRVIPEPAVQLSATTELDPDIPVEVVPSTLVAGLVAE